MKLITKDNLTRMCTKYLCIEDTNIFKEFLSSGEVSTELLEIYVTAELETWGDMVNGVVTFRYEGTTIEGRYVNEDYPAQIIRIYTE